MDIVKLPMDFVMRKPRQLSGGQKQRVGHRPGAGRRSRLLVADEPVSALDVSVQAAIINLLMEIQAKRDATLVFISHDLSVVRYLADHVAVMYLGKIVEFGSVDDVFSRPTIPIPRRCCRRCRSPTPTCSRSASSSRAASRADEPRSRSAVPSRPAARARSARSAIRRRRPSSSTATGHRIACHIPLAELSAVEPVISTAAAE